MTQISEHEIRVVSALKGTSAWLTAADVAETAAVAARTARHHCGRLVKRGLLEQVEVFPGYRYRYAPTPGAAPYATELEAAAKLFGCDLEQSLRAPQGAEQ